MAERPDPAYLHERLICLPDEGRLIWRPWPAHGRLWNDRYPGTEAFTALNTGGYPSGCIDAVHFLAHLVIWAMVYGVWPDDEVDHEDHDRRNNRIGNLRLAGKLGNSRNLSRYSSNVSGVTGVGWMVAHSKWRARITVEQVTIYLGLFDTFDEAVAVRRAAEQQHNFHSNHGAPAPNRSK